MQGVDIEIMVQRALHSQIGDSLPKEYKLKFLDDNGPEFIEKKLKAGLKSQNSFDCNFTSYSRQSNGMCEALNVIFEIVYVDRGCLDSTQTVLDQMDYMAQKSQLD
jgi:putative transposase